MTGLRRTTLAVRMALTPLTRLTPLAAVAPVACVAMLAMPVISASQGASSGVRSGFVVEPDTVRVGQPATLTVRVQAPAGTRFTFPEAVDSTASVEPLDPVSVREETSGDVVEATAIYRLLAWEVGRVTIPLGAIRLTRDGRAQDLMIGEPTVVVQSVLPADSALRVPRPQRGIALLPVSEWPWWLLIVAGFVLAALAGWLLQRRQRRGPPPIEPFAEAQRGFGRLSALDLISAGEPAKHVSASVDVLRRFLAARDPRATLGLTASELVTLLRDDGAVPAARVAALLTAADAVKFAPRDVDARTAESLGAEAAAVVTEIHRNDHERSRRP
jgi:hypothetical protein